jgi:hypothetical protein
MLRNGANGKSTVSKVLQLGSIVDARTTLELTTCGTIEKESDICSSVASQCRMASWRSYDSVLPFRGSLSWSWKENVQYPMSPPSGCTKAKNPYVWMKE